jgi:NTE family protein
MPRGKRVAIACQGGGSHAAFVAGVLCKLLSPDLRDRFELTAISGTSGGAICASLAWAGLVAGGSEGQSNALRRLQGFWKDLEVHDVLDAWTNFWSVWLTRAPFTAEVSPYAYVPIAEPRLRELLATHLALETLPVDPGRRTRPKLLIGATDILAGERVVFHGETLKYDDVIASAAVPPLFRAVNADGKLYWDGLFSTNPPVREFTDLPEKPEEVWVVQINPQRRQTEPRVMSEIIDRRNELSGNLSLGQELYFISKINELCRAYPVLAACYQEIKVRIVELDIEDLDHPSKLDRSRELIHHLMDRGEKRAEWFFDERSEWPRPGSIPNNAVSPAR